MDLGKVNIEDHIVQAASPPWPQSFQTMKCGLGLELISKVFSHSNSFHDGNVFQMGDLSFRYFKMSCPKPHCKSETE